MIELLKLLLSLSLSGTLLILFLLLCKPLYKYRLSRQWQYYIWLIVIARLLLPFTPETSLVGNLFRGVDPAISNISTGGPAGGHLLPETDFAEHSTTSDEQTDTQAGESTVPEKSLVQRLPETAAQNIWLICVLVWLMAAVGLLIRKVTIYQSFVKYIHAGSMEVTDMRLWEQLGKLVEQAGVKRTVGLYTNSLISSPLLIGFLHPCIILPSAELSESDLKNTILHELTHYKRCDMFYKWLVQIAICFHWFNPFVYFMGREINRACEFSCDEAVIRTFDQGAQRAYGDTLLNAIGAGGKYNDSLASVMLNENAELLKERLDAIMKFKKSTRFTAAISIAFVFTLCFGATAAGAYTNPKLQPKDNIVENSDKENIDLASVASYRVTAGSGPKQALDYSEMKQTGFLFSQGQKLQVDVDFISAFHPSTSDHSVTLVFVDSLQHTVELVLNEGEKGEITFEHDGVYRLSIQNDEDISLKYSFILQGSKAVSQKADTNKKITMNTLNIGGKLYYRVENEAQLRAIGRGEYSLDKNYIQDADIYMSSDEWIPIGTEAKPFTGSYCGNGYEIIGLFGVADGAEIYNITMRDYDIQTAGRNAPEKSLSPILALGYGFTRSYDNQVYPKEK